MDGRFLVCLAWLLLSCTVSSAQTVPQTKTFTRSYFEKTLLERSKPDSLATDAAGAWDNVYQYIAVAKYLNRTLYENALMRLREGSEDCGKVVDRFKILACSANRAATNASSLTLFASAVEFRRDAVAYAEQVADRDPAPLLSVLLDLASDEVIHGSLANAEAALSRASEIGSAASELLTKSVRFRFAILRAKLADARLDDATAQQALTEAVSLIILSKVQASDEDYIHPGPIDDLTRLHLRGRFCTRCGEPIAKPIKDWLTAVLTGAADEDTGTEQPQYEHLLLALSAPPGSFTPDELASFSRRYLKLLSTNGLHPDAQRAMRSTGQNAAIVRQFALSNSLIGSTGARESEFVYALSALRPSDSGRQRRIVREILTKIVSDQYEQFGADSQIASALDNLSRHLQAFGFQNQARATLQFLMDRETASGSSAFRKEQDKLANIYAPALAQLASLQLAGGDERSALQRLAEASALAAAKLREEWTFGGAGAILTLRDLAPALRLIAQKRSEIVNARGPSRNGPGHEALFRAMQAAMLGETALALEVADQRRLLSDEPARALRQRYLEAVAEADRAAEIADYQYESGDVDGALARAQRAAQDRRDVLRRAFEAKVPAALIGTADIEPVPIAQAAARLQDGEAITLLHVGSHAVHGFLLDGTGQSYAWRSVVRREALEALVRSLRGGGDVSGGPFPPFPFADAAKLHDLIFGPVKDRLGAYRKLVVVGDGPLQAMPYSILLTAPVDAPPKTGEQMRAASLPWLIRSHAIALMPSVRSFVAQRSAARNTPGAPAGKPFLGIGDPRLADAGSTMRSIDVAGAFSNTGLADIAMLRSVASLPETADELRAIAKLLDVGEDALLLGDRASERTIRSMPLSDYRIVAFATHGALAGEVTGTREPGLVLTPPEQASREDDGFLALSEIANLRFDADLVLLSACNTGTPDGRPRAEGLSGLARGFFSAGARSLMVTHWYIPSESAPTLTAGLIAERKRHPGIDWAEAHRTATLALIDKEGPAEWSHPAYWGGFAVVGVMPTAAGRN